MDKSEDLNRMSGISGISRILQGKEIEDEITDHKTHTFK